MASLNATSIVYPPETKRKYSNAGIAVVGYVLERRSGEPFAAYLKRSVLQPLGLTSSAFEPEPALVRRLAQGEMWTLHDRSFNAPNFQLGMSPAGSMYSTLPDLARFMSVLFAGGRGPGGAVVKAATLDSMWRPQYAPRGARGGAGLGFQVGVLDGRRMVSHGGAIYGFATPARGARDEKIGVAVSAAKDGMNALTDRLADEALRLMLAARAGRPLRRSTLRHCLRVRSPRRWRGRTYVATWSSTSWRADSTIVLRSTALDHQQGLRRWRGDTLLSDDGMSYGTRVWRRGSALVVDGVPYVRRAPERHLRRRHRRRGAGWWGSTGGITNVLYILEKGGRLTALIEWFFEYPLTRISDDVYALPQLRSVCGGAPRLHARR